MTPPNPPLCKNFKKVFDERAVVEEKEINPVLKGCEFAYQYTDLVKLDEDGIRRAAEYIYHEMRHSSAPYTPLTWRTHPLHPIPNDHPPSSLTGPAYKFDAHNTRVLNWIFLVSALNFSFWSDPLTREDKDTTVISPSRHTITYKNISYTGYWTLPAALNRALDAGIPITEPEFYAGCSEDVIRDVFRGDNKVEMPMLRERIGILREVGGILCAPPYFYPSSSPNAKRIQSSKPSFSHFLSHHQPLTPLALVQALVATFPSFRDEVRIGGRKICLWKRAQICVGEMWAAFCPASSPSSFPVSVHPIFPHPTIHTLTMFADYRVPQVLNYLGILVYPKELFELLSRDSCETIKSGSREEVSIRAASVVGVERVRESIALLVKNERGQEDSRGTRDEDITSVLIDFFLWDLAKRIEGEGKMVPVHRTRSIWY